MQEAKAGIIIRIECWGEEKCRERDWQICAGFLSSLFLRTNLCIHMRKIRLRKDHQREVDRATLGSRRARNNSCSYQAEWKDLINEPSGSMFSSRPIIPKLNLLQ